MPASETDLPVSLADVEAAVALDQAARARGAVGIRVPRVPAWNG